MEKKLAMDDGDTRDDTVEKTQNDSDTESDEWKCDLNMLMFAMRGRKKVFKMWDDRPILVPRAFQ